jgi:FkbM family methyltransferase
LTKLREIPDPLIAFYDNFASLMKTAVKYILHTLLGFRTYLYVFARYKILTLRNDEKEKDFFYFLRLLPKAGTVLDIGANIGIMTVHLARESNRKVIAFEPIPINRDTLNRVVKLYSLQEQVRLLDYALGNENGTVEMVMPVNHGVRMQGLSHVLHESIPENNQGDRFSVPLRKLDALDELKSESSIIGIKMDVENFESFVLEGGRELLQKHKPVVYIELWDNANRVACFTLFNTLGYTVYVVQGRNLIAYTDSLRHKQNFIVLPSGHPAQGKGVI